MRILVAVAALLLGMAPALAQKAGETDGNADVLNGLMLKATDRCYALAGAERAACCGQYFDHLCEDAAVGAPALAQSAPLAAPTATPAAAPAAVAAQPAAASRSATAQARPASSGDGPARALNTFVMKEITQCRTMSSAREQRACCEKIMHPNACVQ